MEGSLHVYPLTLLGGADKVEQGAEVNVNKCDSTPEENEYQLNTKGFILNLGSIDSAYRVIYKTSLDDTQIAGNYKNQAVLKGKDGENYKEYFNKAVTVSPKNGGEYIRKDGLQGNGDDVDIATWTVGINYSQSQIAAGSVLKDSLSAGQILLPDSWRLYSTVIPEDNSGKVTRGELFPEIDNTNEYNYSLEIDQDNNSYTLTFLKPISSAYILEYKSFITAQHGDKIDNSVEFSGSGITGDEPVKNKEITIYFADAGGGTYVGTASLQIEKRDQQGEPIAGAEFELYTMSDTFLEKVITGEDGIATTTNKYRYNSQSGYKYKLKESRTPAGYLLNDAYKAGKEILFKGSEYKIAIENSKIHQAIELTKIDAENNTPLAGVEFKLQKKNTAANYEDIPAYASLVTGADGKIYLGDLLDPGAYRLIETKTLEGYWLDNTPQDFTIEKDQLTATTMTMSNSKQGSLTVRKLDKAGGNPLVGAVFKLYDSLNNLIASATTGIDGIVEFINLKYGSYKLNEASAPVGYVSAGDIDININSANSEESVENEKIHQAVTLIKTDQEDPSIKLRGAVFELYKDDALVSSDELITDSEGRISLNNLSPGAYYFKETSAPEYYLLPVDETERKYPFTIIEEQKTITPVDAANKRGKGKIEIIKVDAEDVNILLPGAEFTLKKEGELPRTGKTDSNGVLLFDNLEYDSYTLEEIGAPDGYNSITAPIDIVLKGDADGLLINKTIKNSKKIDIIGTKKWIGGPALKPDIQLQLYRNALPLGEAVELPGDKDQHTWAGLDKVDIDGNIYSYSIDELNPPTGYRKTLSADGLTITNTYRSSGGGDIPPQQAAPEKPEPEPLPEPKPEPERVKVVDKIEIVDKIPLDKDTEKKIVLKEILLKENKGPEKPEAKETIVDNTTGQFTIEGLETSKTYEFAVITEYGDEELVTGKVTISVNEDGDVEINEELIDPYGTIKDSRTEEVIGGAEITLYYADTPRNREQGRIPGTLVTLPLLPGFEPNENQNPQVTTFVLVFNDHPEVEDHGNYAWMVFAKTDYYIVAKKEGYKTYTSDTISVEYDIVKHDIDLDYLSPEEMLPKTGEGAHLGFYLAGALCIFIGLSVLKRRKKEVNE